MSYQIVVLHNTQHPLDPKSIPRAVGVENSHSFVEPTVFDTLAAAQAKIDDLNSEIYVLSNSELARPDYYVLEDGIAHDILNWELDRPDYSDYEGDDEDDDAILEFFTEKQREAVLKNAVEAI